MGIERRLHEAIENNALWCERVCRTHGAGGEFLPHCWRTYRPAPPFYPNLVTMGAAAAAAAHERAILELLAAGVAGAWGVKDSFASLDLAPHGFRRLFEAHWYWRDPLPLPATDGAAALSWAPITDAAALAAWEAAWRGSPEAAPAIFLPALLAEAGVRVLAAYRERTIVAGVIASESGAVVGITNFFARPEGAVSRADSLAAVARAFPGKPIVGYGSGASLPAMAALGFEMLGPLTVWLRAE